MTNHRIIRVAPLTAALAATVAILAVPAPGRAQDVMSKESVSELKSAFLADIEAMRVKFVGLAEAFPQDKYDWRPMEGVRSVSEVLMLAAMEGYSFIPNAFGGKPADLGSKEEMTKLRTLNTKAQVLDHLNKGFAHAKAQLEAIDSRRSPPSAASSGSSARRRRSRCSWAATCTSTSGS